MQHNVSQVDGLLGSIDRDIARILNRALSDHEVSEAEGAQLFQTHGRDLLALCAAADELRRRAVGDLVTYVVNRNINFTNVCIKRCGFCAFSRGYREEQGYFLPVDELVRRAREAWELGATEVCIQAGLPPKMDGNLYPDICRAIKAELPQMHIHGFSPEEVLYGSVRAKCSIEAYLERLKDAGRGLAAGDVGRDLGRPAAAAHLAGPDLGEPVAAGDHRRAPSGDSHHLYYHVRPRGNPRGLHGPPGLPAGVAEGDRRYHRVRPLEPDPRGSPNVPQGHGGGRAARGNGRGSAADARGGPPHALPAHP